MIYVQLLGGIGNILFQMATAYAHAIDNATQCCFSNNTQSITKREQDKEWFKTIMRDMKFVDKKPKIDFVYKQNKMFLHLQY